EQLFVSNDMSLDYFATSWSMKHEVTFNGANGVLVNSGECVEYPAHLSETKEEDENYYYIYNWYLNGDLYDFSTPVTANINLTSDGTFSPIEKPKYYTVTFNANNGSSAKSTTVLGGTTVARPDDPTKSLNSYRYDFVGWYNGETAYDFETPVTEDLTLTAKYSTTKLLVLSDLYNETYSDRIFKTGEIQVGNAAATSSAPIGYYAEYATTPNFELSFDLKYTAASDYSTFTIQMKSGDEINSQAPFYVGWKLWFYRPEAPIYFQYLQYDGSLADTRVAFENAESSLTLVKDTIYTAKLSYKVIDASTGTVEMSFAIGDWSNTTTYTLGADYFNANAANSNKLLFTVESANGTASNIVAGDPGLIGKARQDVTLMNGNEVFAADSANQITLPSVPAIKNENGLDQVFVGWTTDPNFGEGFKLYSAGYKLQLNEATTLYAVWLGFEMQDGAGVRLAADSSGIRFLTDIDRAGYQMGVNNGLILSVGTIAAPTTYLSKVTLEHGSFPSSSYYVEKETEIWRVEGNENATWTYAAAFVNISEGQYSRAMSARGFIKINFTNGVGYIYTPYTEENNSRSIYAVATDAYNDPEYDYQEHPTILKYINSVADIVLDAENGLTKIGVGSYELNSNVNQETYTFTVNVNGNTPIKTALINGTRMTVGYERNITIGNFVYSISDYALDEANGTITFVLKAAEKLEDKYSDGLVYFQSSDADLDFFLNDYFKRHAGNVFENGVDQKVTSVSAGFTSQEFFWQEWFSLAYYPISSM
ncbi:MAG: InlB B-repeat-containing protein, partial [Clostridia bacterium]|nr:InlB B-repeat-containing protein [Clostridia bacterium]